jgi:hypothetical protein
MTASDTGTVTMSLEDQPEMWVAFNRFYGTLWSHGVLDQPTKEVGRLRSARINDCKL